MAHQSFPRGIGISVLSFVTIWLSCNSTNRSSTTPASPDVSLAMREIAKAREVLDKATVDDFKNFRVRNMYGGDITTTIDAGHRVIFYPNTPPEACVQLMQQLSRTEGVDALGIEGRSPGWRENVTPSMASQDCGAAPSKINIRLK